MRTIKYLGTGVTHATRGTWADEVLIARCGASRSGNVHASLSGTVDCPECLDLLGVLEDPEAFERHWMWLHGGILGAACNGSLGSCHRDTGEVTCPSCKAIPEFKRERADQLKDRLIHLHVGNGETACGASMGGGRLTDPAQVTCIACLEAVEIPRIEEQGLRRILLQGDEP